MLKPSTENFLSMEEITVYDINSEKWLVTQPVSDCESDSPYFYRYRIVATGVSGIPRARSGFCSVVSRASDDSSFQVTIYGGLSMLEGILTFYDDVWALSIPSFQWIRINDTNNQERMVNGAGAGRATHTCDIWDDSQMIVLGGVYASNGTKSDCDSSYSPIRLLDTSTYSWKTEYRPNNIYSVPSVISAVIGGE